jgi:membrane-associated phospholipid phosphatase
MKIGKSLTLQEKSIMRKFTTFILLCANFWLISQPVHAQNFDIDLLRKINSPNPSQLSIGISNTTIPISIALPLSLGCVALIEKNDDMMKNAIYIGVTLGVNGIATEVLKEAVKRPRPHSTYPDIVSYSTETTLSFPSGHTSDAFATATALSLRYPQWYIIAPSYVWACSVGYSRMNLGVHYPSDVLAGAILGSGCAYVTNLVNNWFWNKPENKNLIHLKDFAAIAPSNSEK